MQYPKNTQTTEPGIEYAAMNNAVQKTLKSGVLLLATYSFLLMLPILLVGGFVHPTLAMPLLLIVCLSAHAILVRIVFDKAR